MPPWLDRLCCTLQHLLCVPLDGTPFWAGAFRRATSSCGLGRFVYLLYLLDLRGPCEIGSNLGLLMLVLGFQSVDVLNAGAPEANERCLMRD